MKSDAFSIIKFFEDCRLTVYEDTGGLPTVGWGHLVGQYDDLKLGDKITQEHADKMLANDYCDAEIRVTEALRDKNFNPKFHEQQALISLAFNLRSFEKLASYLPDVNLFKDKMLLYCKDSKGETQKGLKIRRIAERLLFENREWYEEAKELQRNKFSYLIEREKQLFKKVIPEEEIPKPRGMEEIK